MIKNAQELRRYKTRIEDEHVLEKIKNAQELKTLYRYKIKN